ncbi:MAG: GNAT family N-acetyltransferase [Ktedonobacteraceae bacterium]|nr:GNAT family N-acetyltransferase [Ktedonobacteraceae bacterium]
MQLQTERLLLREFEENDWQAVQRYQLDPLYLRYTPWSQRTEADVRTFVQTFLRWQHEQPRHRFQFVIALRENGQLIGNCGIRSSASKTWEADIGYELDSRCWGRGYATEAARALLDFGFSELRLHRIWAHCIAENTASARVMQKLGMRFEGHFYETEWMKDRWWDTLVYAILDREWKAHSAAPSQ